MTRQEDFEGSSVSEALARAADRLGRSAEEMSYEVLRETRGFLGVIPRSVAIRVDCSVEPARSPRPSPGRLRRRGPARLAVDPPIASALSSRDALAPRMDEDADQFAVDAAELEDLGPDASAPEVEKLVKRLVSGLGLDVQVVLSEEPTRLVLEVSGPDREAVLGRRGEVLDALQYLVTRMARKQLGTRKRVQLESEGFRSNRELELCEMAQRAAEQAKNSGTIVRLSPLNPYERRLVHMTVSKNSGVTTESEGDGFLKRVSVRPTRVSRSDAGNGRGQRREPDRGR